VGFLTRLPVGHDAGAWDALRERPAAFVVVAYGIGGVAGLALLVPVSVAAAVAYVALVYALTGVNHADGLADLGDAAVVHGDRERRREVMRDTTVGVGAVLALGVGLLGLGLGALGAATLPWRVALAVAVAAEVAGKLAMALLTLATPAHEGLGSAFAGASAGSGLLAGVLAVPAAVLAWPALAPVAAVVAGPVVALALWLWARRRLGGVSGDVFGAANELGRVLALHLGVVAWTLS
jgi:adenosylcobinamide-GDP ribazoletransferase